MTYLINLPIQGKFGLNLFLTGKGFNGIDRFLAF
jgi:hypothetical protein